VLIILDMLMLLIISLRLIIIHVNGLFHLIPCWALSLGESWICGSAHTLLRQKGFFSRRDAEGAE